MSIFYSAAAGAPPAAAPLSAASEASYVSNQAGPAGESLVRAVRISTLVSVTSKVCSNCADRLPS